jgi:hypothetical protein
VEASDERVEEVGEDASEGDGDEDWLEELEDPGDDAEGEDGDGCDGEEGACGEGGPETAALEVSGPAAAWRVGGRDWGWRSIHGEGSKRGESAGQSRTWGERVRGWRSAMKVASRERAGFW